MSTTVTWPMGMTRITVAQSVTLPTLSSFLQTGTFVVGEGGNLTEYLKSPEFQRDLEYEKGMRVETIRHAQGLRVSDLLEISPTVTLGTVVGGRGANEDFHRHVESMQNPQKRHLIDVSKITKTPKGVDGFEQFSATTKNTGKYASVELPFVSSSKEKYLEALDYYGGEGSFPHVRAEIMGQAKARKPTQDIGSKWFRNGPYVRVENVSKTSSRAIKSPDSIFQEYTNKITTLTDAVNDLRNYFGKNPPALPDDKIAVLRQGNGPFKYVSLDEIQAKWYKYLMASVPYLFDHLDNSGIMQKGVTFEDLFNHFSVNPQ